MKGLLGYFFFISILVVLFPTGAMSGESDSKKPTQNHSDNDTVFLQNGDRITGEIKSVQNGILFLKTNFSNSTLQLDWLQVRGLESNSTFEFEDKDENFYVGVILIEPAKKIPDGRIKVKSNEGSIVELTLVEVIGIHELRRKLHGSLNLDLDAGITFTQGNNQIQTTVQMVLQYSKPRHTWNLNTSSIFSGQSDGTSTSRQEIGGQATRTLSKSWETIGIADLLHDNELDLDLRGTIGGGVQRIFTKTNNKLFAIHGGLAYTRADYSGAAEGTIQNLGEAFAGVSLSIYQFGGSALSSYARIFPSFTDPGRFRVDVYAYWKWQLTDNLYWKLSTFNDFDNGAPPGVEENNFGFTSSIGWSF